MRVVIIDYGSGNLRSAAKAFAHVAAARDGAIEVRVSAEAREVAAADRLVLPGVGAFADCLAGLRAVSGLTEALTRAVRDKGRPFLGVCVGMQLLATRGFEHGTHDGLGWIEGEVHRLAPDDPSLKVPHMGWNELIVARAHPLLAGMGTDAHAYFVHSYHLLPRDESIVLARAEYGGKVVAVIARDNIAGTQFHPEKSQEVGLRLIDNFLGWRP